MLEHPVFRVRPVNFNHDLQGARGHFPAWADVVAGKELDHRSGHCDHFTNPQAAIGVEFRSTCRFYVGTGYQRAPDKVVPNDHG